MRGSGLVVVADNEIPAPDQFLVFHHSPFRENYPVRLRRDQGPDNQLVALGVPGGNHADPVEVGLEQPLEQAVVSQRPDRFLAGQMIDVIRKKHGFQPGEMIDHENDRPGRDIGNLMKSAGCLDNSSQGLDGQIGCQIGGTIHGSPANNSSHYKNIILR